MSQEPGAIDTPAALEVVLRSVLKQAAANNCGGLVAIALLEAIKLDVYADLREANRLAKVAERRRIVRATVLPPNGENGRRL